MVPNGFSEATVVVAEGARVGVVTCDQCGAAILLDPRDTTDRCERHVEWHRASHSEALEARLERAREALKVIGLRENRGWLALRQIAREALAAIEEEEPDALTDT